MLSSSFVARRLPLALATVVALASPSQAQQPLDDAPVAFDRDLPSGPVTVMAPATDTSLCMSWEPTIAVDPNDPLVVAVSQFTTVQVSFDGGNSFPVSVTAPAVTPNGDPSLAFDSQGRMFLTYLCRPGAGRDVCITGWAVDRGTASVTLLPGGWPVNVSAASGVGGANADKEWLAADAWAGSPFRDTLHVAWIRLDTNPWSTWVSSSTNQGQAWSAAQQVSAADEGTAWPCHVAVGPDGRAYVAWHAQPGFLDAPSNDLPDGVSGQIVLRRSDDGGAVWQPRSFPYGPGQADVTYNVQHEASGQIPGHSAWLPGSLQPWILPDPLVAGRVHVVQNDDPDDDHDTGDSADVFIVTSADFAATWGARRRVDQGPPGTFQILPAAAINPVNGAIGVAWYDNRALADANLDGIFELDFLATSSLDGGFTWSAEVDVNDGRMDPARAGTCRFCGSDGVTNQACGTLACPGPGTGRIGEYVGVAFGECTLHFAWADDATCGGDYDTFYDRDPALGGDVAAPSIACPSDAVLPCGAPTDVGSTGMATAIDGCDADPAVTWLDIPEPPSCPPGSIVQRIRRRFTAADAAGNTATCDQIVETADMGPPVVNVPPPLLLECNGPGGVPVTDPQVVAWLASASASDDCSVPVLSHDAPPLLPFGCAPGGTPTIVTFTAVDACGHAGSNSSTISVVDTTPPAVAASVATPVLWPPNHELVDVGLSVVAADGCSPGPPAITVTVSSDEDADDEPGSGGPVHCPDAVVLGDGTLLVRAERAGTGDGRVLRVTVTAADACGNQASAEAFVSVPKSKGSQGAASDSGQAHDATACD